MSFSQAVQSGFQNYANFSGRALRSEYWWWVVFAIVSAVIVAAIDAALGASSLLSYVYSLALLLPGLAVSVRRLHDRGRTGWWMLVIFVPLLGGLFLLAQFVSRGDAEANRYGPAKY